MLRLTVSGPVAASYRAGRKPSKTTTQTVYRWGNCWGFLRDGDWAQRWTVEVRTPVAQEIVGGTSTLLETVLPGVDVAPPMELDDQWKEEVEWDERGVSAVGASLALQGTPEELRAFCETQRIPFPSADKSPSKIQHVL
jgi:hypothetical protein